MAVLAVSHGGSAVAGFDGFGGCCGGLLGGFGGWLVRYVMDIEQVKDELDRIIDELSFSSCRLGMNNIEVMDLRMRLERLSSEIEFGCGFDFLQDDMAGEAMDV